MFGKNAMSPGWVVFWLLVMALGIAYLVMT